LGFAAAINFYYEPGITPPGLRRPRVFLTLTLTLSLSPDQQQTTVSSVFFTLLFCSYALLVLALRGLSLGK